MTNIKTLHARLRAAAKALETAQAAEQRVRELLSPEGPVLDYEALDAARRQYQDSSAAAALGEASPDALERARAELAAAEATAAEAQSVAGAALDQRAGLERRLADATRAVEQAEADLHQASADWLLAQIDCADQTYTQAIEEAAAAYARTIAAGRLLEIRKVNFPMATAVAGNFAAPVAGPHSLDRSSGRPGGGIRGQLVDVTRLVLDEHKAALRDELQALGGLW